MVWPFRSTRSHIEELRKRTAARRAEFNPEAPWPTPIAPLKNDCQTTVSADFTSQVVKLEISAEGLPLVVLAQDMGAAIVMRDALTRAIDALTAKDGVDITDQVGKDGEDG